MRTIKVMIVDDSPTVRSVLQKGLERAKGIEVVSVAPDPYVARDLIVKDPPDVLTLDIEMPRMDGLTFLRKLMQHFPLPVVVVSTLTTKGSQTAMDALAAGAVEVVGKCMNDDQVNDFMLEVVRKVRAAATATVRKRAIGHTHTTKREAAPQLAKIAGDAANRVVAVGSSTGGTEALNRVLRRLPADAPGTVIVQHMPPGFTAQMSERLNQISAMEVREARDGDEIRQGLALVAPGDRHMLVRRFGSGYKIELRDGPRVGLHKPAVNVLFKSVAKVVGDKAIGVILTGMGRDGAEGMLEMKQAGAHNIAQNEETCVVYGMPREAVELGATDEIAALDRIADKICAAVSLQRT